MNKVLIILSTYNGEKYLRELLDSVFCQDFKNIDLLVRDDGSTDCTFDILREYSKSHSLRIIRGENKGAAESFFDLVDTADVSYDFYAFCDQDDVWLPHKISVAVGKLLELSSTIPALYYSGQILVDEKLNVLSKHKTHRNRSEKANFIFNQMAGCTAVVNNKLFRLMKKYRPHNVFMHDAWCYKLCITCGGQVVADDQEYIYYRQHEDNTIGYNNNLVGKLRQIKPALINSPSSYAGELLRGYSKEINSEWLSFLNELVNKNPFNACKLIFDKDIRFNSASKRMIFIIKILLGKY